MFLWFFWNISLNWAGCEFEWTPVKFYVDVYCIQRMNPLNPFSSISKRRFCLICLIGLAIKRSKFFCTLSLIILIFPQWIQKGFPESFKKHNKNTCVQRRQTHWVVSGIRWCSNTKIGNALSFICLFIRSIELNRLLRGLDVPLPPQTRRWTVLKSLNFSVDHQQCCAKIASA